MPGPPILGVVLMSIVAAWIVLSVFCTVTCAAVLRGGLREDRLLGHVVVPR